MDKPIIFFSHSSKDAEMLGKLKELFVEKTGGTIEVFLSSDGQSIPLGRNWVHRIEEALGSAKLMVVFVSPNSMNSKWLYFESGFAYCKGLRVVPVGINGVDLNSLQPPLSLLQGFNIRSADSLDNLIQLANDQFGYSHSIRFNEAEYREVFSLGDFESGAALGISTAFIDEIRFSVTSKISTEPDFAAWINSTIEYLKSKHVPVQLKGDISALRLEMYFEGVSVAIDKLSEQGHLYFRVDPTLLQISSQYIDEILTTFGNSENSTLLLEIHFLRGVDAYAEVHKLSARLHESTIEFHEKDGMRYSDLVFWISRWSRNQTGLPSVQIRVSLPQWEIPIHKLKELLDILVSKGILFFPE